MSNSCRHVLLVDDEEQILATSKLALEIGGIREVSMISDSREVVPFLEAHQVSVLVLDLSMPHVSGLELLESVTRDYPQIPIIVVTANDEIATVVECMKLGAFDYLAKPVSPGRLLTSVQKALERCTLSNEITSLKQRLLSDNLEHPAAFAGIVTRNRQMRSMFQYLEVIAGSRQPIIITGETGVGKELVARAVHQLSGSKGEFIALNAAGLDDHMFSDSLFGHKKGAFTGADQAREGLIARAAGGTLFLDEIGDLNELSQLKLLRLLQEREYYPVGSDLTRKSDAHFVLATNRDLQARIAEGKFRNDLYYRLCGHQVQVPPLRERKDDLPLLLDHFIRQEAEALGIPAPGYPKELVDLLETYHFPGNVRELQAMVSDAVPRSKSRTLSQEPFRQAIATDLGQKPQPPQAELKDDASLLKKLEAVWGHFPTLNEAEDLLIGSALAAAKGNQGIAATMLGLKRQTLNMRLKVRREADND
ncbi:sigma-54-dependent Fis family transcriptional regulator [Geomonas silvestris]|uniref:Sigma-54-dependent Fis family transcriptional regulator n=1 Tax=Geomonas silvestris TaxID=2740184 RepID=A0A6V8MI61_9BACT|nr:sigma-54 dependent transcriptional regulator [Geomonas silvestris]GFO59624.1 sigma-54-dependent Fis family transcriptional regulator [Geomonas silvestris]